MEEQNVGRTPDSLIPAPRLSVLVVTYNHAPYIRECMDSILMQETDFPFEVIVHDDASTDETADIICEYVEKFSGKIFPILQSQNQYSAGHLPMEFLLPKVRGEYTAYCEGDDYWTDPLKLQKQVDILDSHPECVAVFHDFMNYDQTQGILRPRSHPEVEGEGFWVDSYWDSRHWITQPLTTVYRTKVRRELDLPPYEYLRDIHVYYHLLKKGRGYWMNVPMGVYRWHPGGMWNQFDERNKHKIKTRVYSELYRFNPDDPYARKKYLECKPRQILFSFSNGISEFMRELFSVFKEPFSSVHIVLWRVFVLLVLIAIRRMRRILHLAK